MLTARNARKAISTICAWACSVPTGHSVKACELFALLAWTSVACTPEQGDPPGASGSQERQDWVLSGRTPQLLAFVVDDSPDATSLRTAIAQHITEAYDADCAAARDPAAWHPVDRTAIIVRPSAPEPDRFITPLENPALHWQAQQWTCTDAPKFAAAIARALIDTPSVQGPMPILERAVQLPALLTGARAPESEVERAVAAAMPAHGESAIFVAAAHDDESSEAAETYVVKETMDSIVAAVIAPLIEGQTAFDDCGFDPAIVRPRFSRWIQANKISRSRTWPCSRLDLLPRDRRPTERAFCMRSKPRVGESGVAECRVYMTTAANPTDEACPGELGWLDPLSANGERLPDAREDNGVQLRRCEVMQLEGVALDSCRNSLACENCTPGWCWTEVPELTNECDERGEAGSFRFVGGSDSRDGKLTLVCNSEED